MKQADINIAVVITLKMTLTQMIFTQGRFNGEENLDCQDECNALTHRQAVRELYSDHRPSQTPGLLQTPSSHEHTHHILYVFL